ncbi:MAG: hypothetical protein M3065_06625 [Actinomycetota bacterium]|nr:hypothetical protein [Actinomycetota bacterium]
MEGFPTVRQGARVRLNNGQTGQIVFVVPNQLVAEGSSRGLARVKLDHDGEKDVTAEHIAEFLPDQ